MKVSKTDNLFKTGFSKPIIDLKPVFQNL